MCQLCMINLGDPVLNSVVLANALQINALANNKDGTGFLSVSKKGKPRVFKSEIAAYNLINLGSIIESYNKNSNSPLMGHVRYASKSKVSDDNSHPFEGERFILTHNGTLYGKDEVVEYNAKSSPEETSDSKQFLDSLELCAKMNPEYDIVKYLEVSMAQFKGKFAFMIYDKITSSHYVVRGSSADLHIQYLYKELDSLKEDTPAATGFVINTRKDSLDNIIGMSLPVLQILTGEPVSYGPITELEEESVYLVKGTGLEKIGVLKENPVVRAVTSPFSEAAGAGWTNGGVTSEDVNENIPEWKLGMRLFKFMVNHLLNHSDIDALFSIFLGMPMSELTMEGLETFVYKVIPKISANKLIRKKFSALIGKRGRLTPYIYSDIPGFEYPWMLNDKEHLDALLSKLSKRDAMK